MKRRLSIAAVVLLSLSGLILALMFAQSFWTGGKLGWESLRVRNGLWERRHTDILWGDGTIGLSLDWRRHNNPHEWYPQHAYSHPDIDYIGHGNYGSPGPWSWLTGFGFRRGTFPDGTRQTIRIFELWSPFWLPLALLWFWPLVWLTRAVKRRVRRSSRRRRGCCSACGYDLRASSDKCPECGAAIGQ